MKRFRFSLQPIRILREQKERTSQQRFAEAVRIYEEAAYHLQEASDALANGWSTLCESLASGIAASKLRRDRSWCNVLEQRQKESNNALVTARRAMDSAWRDMAKATRDREALDRYHDKSRRAYEREAQRQEQKTLDELGVQRSFAPGSPGSPYRKTMDRL